MPKTNDATGASYAGVTGVVEHAAPIDDGRKLSELDPERNLDGTLIEGTHPDAEDAERDLPVSTTDPTPIESPEETPEQAEEVESPESPEREEESSPGTSFSASTPKTSKTSGRNASADRSHARTTGSHS